MGSSAEVLLINFGNFILSNGNEINILNDIESVQFDDKTIDLYGDDGRQFFTNANMLIILMVLGGKIIGFISSGSVTSGVTLDASFVLSKTALEIQIHFLQ